LPEGRRKRRPRRARKPRDGLIPFDCRIDQRPDFIADRSQFGHWEGDLLIFERALGNANVTSLVERKSRYTVMIKTGRAAPENRPRWRLQSGRRSPQCPQTWVAFHHC
jgi:IS30 family transposase